MRKKIWLQPDTILVTSPLSFHPSLELMSTTQDPSSIPDPWPPLWSLPELNPKSSFRVRCLQCTFSCLFLPVFPKEHGQRRESDGRGGHRLDGLRVPRGQETEGIAYFSYSFPLRITGRDALVNWESQGSLHSLHCHSAGQLPHLCDLIFFLMRLCCLVRREEDLLQVTCVDGSSPSPSGSSSHRFLFLGSPYNSGFSACELRPPCEGQTTLSQRSHFIYRAY